MSQPFVVSMKILGDGSSGAGAVKQVTKEIEHLQQVAARAATGSNVQGGIDRMLGIGSSSRSMAEAEADLAAYGNQLDDLRAKYNPLFAAERQHEANLAGIQSALRVGAISADEMAAAVDREKAAHLAAVAALDSNSQAHQRNATAMARSSAQRTNLLFQLQDVAVTLAMGMNPLMVAMQQGSQISMIYGPEEGGLGKALSETGKIAGGVVSKLWVVALAATAIGTGVAGMRYEIEKASGKAVSFGDVFLAVFQVIGGYLYGTFKPAIDAIGGWFAKAWEWVKSTTRDVGNFIVREIVGAIDIISTAVGSLPEVFIVAGQAAANGFTNTMITAFRWVQEQFNGLLKGINDLAGSVGMSPVFEPVKLAEFVDFDSGGSDAAKRLEAGWAGLADRLKDVAGTDYMGNFFGDVLDQAVDNFTERTRDKKAEAKLAAAYQRIVDSAKGHIKNSEIERQALGMTEEAANRLRYSFDLLNQARDAGIKLSAGQVADLYELAGAMAAAEAQTKALSEIYSFGRDTLRGFFGDLLQGSREGVSAWENLGNAAANALERIADRALQMAADGIWDMIFGAVFGAAKPATGVLSFIPGLGGVGRNAKGTDSWRGGLTWVGEEGPELVDVPARSRIYDAGTSRDMAASPMIAFSPVNHFTVSGGAADIPTFERLLGQRDEALVAQFHQFIAAYLANPMRRPT